MKKYFLLPLFVLFFLLISYTPTLSSSSLVINELFPNPSDGEVEWIELFNDSGIAVDLNDWIIEDVASHSAELKDLGIIEPNQFKVLSGEADGWLLNNSSETIFLRDNLGNVIDSYSYESTQEGLSFARVPDGGSNWLSLQTPTEGTTNGNSPTPSPTPTPTPTPTSTITPSPTPTLDPNNISNIYLNELFPSPVSGKEWIELYNDNDHEVVINNWYLDDTKGKKYINNITIPSKDKIYFEFDSGFLNNTGEMIYLKYGDIVKDQLPEAYPSIEKGYSWSKINGTWCISEPTKGSNNISCYVQEAILDSENIDNNQSDQSKSENISKSKNKVIKNKSINSHKEISDRNLPAVVKTASSPRVASVAGVSTMATKNTKPKLLIPIIISLFGLLVIVGSLYPYWLPKIRSYFLKINI